jgi:transcriptional regulator with XRE-family HTH domain
MIDFGSTIKTYRRKKGLTQVALARRIGIESTYLSAIENGRREPSLTLVKQISKAVAIPAEVLFWDAIELSDSMSSRDRRAMELAKSIVHQHFKIL